MPSKVQVYSDGGARGNPGPAAIGVLILDERGRVLKQHRERIGETTNNVAEYTAVLVGLELAKSAGAEEIRYFLDSELVARQLSGKYRVRTEHIRSLFLQVKEKEKKFTRVMYTHVPRTHPQIKHVDRLLNQALDFDEQNPLFQ